MNNSRSFNDLISVIVPVYNTKNYLDECINSILKQTYVKLEILIIDDGSTDETGDMCERYLDIDDRVKVYHKANEGLGLTRNYGIKKSNGKYICFIDSDDKIENNFVEHLYTEMIKNHVDVCKAGFTRFADNNILKKIQYAGVVYKGDEAKTEFLPRLIGSSPEKHDSVEMAVCGVLYKADIIKGHSIEFPSERVLIYEDMIFNIKYFQYANGGCLTSSTGYYYRVNEFSLTMSYRQDRFEAYKKFYQYVNELLISFGYDIDTTLRLDRYFFICLRKCLQQESHNPNKSNITRNIKEICSDETVKTILEQYPIHKLGYKQKVFLLLIKAKAVSILNLAIRFNVL